MSLFLDEITISGVKGVSREVTLDLRAGLTLLYAPNGTGKTSVWSAIEALLTGGVTENLKCCAADSPALNIEAKLDIGGQAYDARLAEHSSLSLVQFGGNALLGRQALAVFAPECSVEGVQKQGGAALKRLEDHVRGTRFLPADSLLYLIDGSVVAVELRRRLFADLTGTTSLQSEHRELAAYVQRLRKALLEKRTHWQNRRGDLTSLKERTSGNTIDARGLMQHAFQLAGIVTPLTTDSDELLIELRSLYRDRNAPFKRRSEQVESLKAIATAHPMLDQDLAKLEQSQVDAVTQADSIRRDVEQRQLQLSKLGAELRTSETLWTALDRGKLGLTAFVDETEGSSLPDASRERWSFVRLKDLARDSNEANARKARIADAKMLLAEEAQWARLLRDRNDAEQLCATLRNELGDEVEIARLADRARQLQLALEKIASNTAEIGRLRAMILVSAEQLIASEPNEACPCCSYRWNSVAELRSAIQANAALAPQHARETSEARLILQQELDEISATIAKQADVRERQIVALRIVQQSELGISPFAQAAFRLDCKLSEASVPFIVKQLETLRLSELAQIAIAGLAGLELPAVIELPELLGRIQEMLDEQSSRQLALRPAIQKNADETSALRVQLAEADRASTVVESRVVVLRQARARRQELANALLLGEGFADDQIRQVAQELETERTFLSQLEDISKQASDALASDAAREALAGIEAEVAKLNEEISRIEREVERANRLANLVEEAEQSHSQQLFSRIGPAIGTLFHHMQVNRVFREIDFNVAQQSFSITGKLSDQVVLQPGLHFSQGQKQDLALSMFLARACTLGGSFFLDEPLLHLDDLNRTALLDCLRACVLGTRAAQRPVRLFVTTASWNVARHLIQKFSSIRNDETLLRVYQLEGNVRVGVSSEQLFPSGKSETGNAVH